MARLAQNIFADLGIEHLVPNGTRRCVIDISIDNAVRVYWDTFGGDELDKLIPYALRNPSEEYLNGTLAKRELKATLKPPPSPPNEIRGT